jgi:putative endopeptidase
MNTHANILKVLAGTLLVISPALAQTKGPGRPSIGSFGFDAAGMDRTVAPGQDFGRYANGDYLKKLVLPADQSSYGMFNKLRDLSQKRTRSIVEAAAAVKDPKPGSETQQIGDFYRSFMDEARIEAQGLAPLRIYLDTLALLGSRSQVAAAFGTASRLGVANPVAITVEQDLKAPASFAVNLGQGGLGMPDRDYYLDLSNPRFTQIRGQYLGYIASMLTLAGYPDGGTQAAAILALETKLAAVHWTKVEERQVEKQYNPVTAADLATAYPGLDWPQLLAAAGLPAQKRLNIVHPSAIQGTAKLVATEPVEVWKHYLTFRFLSRSAPFLPKAFAEEHFAFYGKVLSGQPEIQARWKRGVDATTDALGEAVGRLYVAKHFPPKAKGQMDLLVKNLITAMDHRLGNLTWMDPKTKAEAQAKLAVFTAKIGYPGKWRDYSRLEVNKGEALGNALRGAEFAYLRNLDKIGQPVDRSEWGMTPMTVNAYANPLWNEIVFPAAILQPPFFDPKADPAVNYGAIGTVIGHEISHHFDDQGRKYDKEGKLSDWWTAEDVKRFKALTDQLVKQYGAYEAQPGLLVNGELTLGENMADLAGITVALDAYHASLGGKPAPVLGGMTGDQRFFLGFAQVWRQKYRDAALLKQVITNEHTPGFLRPNVVRNLDAWYAAFGVKPGQALFLAPEERIKVW